MLLSDERPSQEYIHEEAGKQAQSGMDVSYPLLVTVAQLSKGTECTTLTSLVWERGPAANLDKDTVVDSVGKLPSKGQE